MIDNVRETAKNSWRAAWLLVCSFIAAISLFTLVLYKIYMPNETGQLLLWGFNASMYTIQLVVVWPTNRKGAIDVLIGPLALTVMLLLGLSWVHFALLGLVLALTALLTGYGIVDMLTHAAVWLKKHSEWKLQAQID